MLSFLFSILILHGRMVQCNDEALTWRGFPFRHGEVLESSIIAAIHRSSDYIGTRLTALNVHYCFFSIGINAYCFAIWFNDNKASQDSKRTVVWMANRDQPVNGKGSKLTVVKNGDAPSQSHQFSYTSTTHSGNVVLLASDGVVLWQSFDSATDTLLSNQPLTRYGKLVSSRSQSNFSSGFYKLFFDNDNVLRLIFDNNVLSSVHWPSPWLLPWDAGRSSYNNSKHAVLESLGYFNSSDKFIFMSADYGSTIQRKLRLDYDGNIRLYSRKSLGDRWVVTWQAFSNPCKIHEICGANGICRYDPVLGRKCSCVPGYKMTNHSDWSYGCEPELVKTSLDSTSSGVLSPMVMIWGSFPVAAFWNAKQNVFEGYKCYPKIRLVNGHQIASFAGDMYLRPPKTYNSSHEEFRLNFSNQVKRVEKTYNKRHANQSVRFMLWFATRIGGIEVVCILIVWCSLIRSRRDSDTDLRERLLAVTGFKRFSFAEPKKATQGFSQEIGRVAGGVVYKGILSNSRVAAVKRLSETCQGEAEFLAEVNTIARLNHMNLIEMWEYCAEGKHRLW
ncbi:Tyrosine-protein kinase [Trema orientale]|uniref:non-specific serine/threonine protein kinase n=1 Tax=Trema orientale TaxID=63057 RepID=A0A2P5EGN1_TREOI|nr:Tyrosine-protein kinase [Trema orientale]